MFFMASVRNIKKNIDCLIMKVIADCFSFGSDYPDKNPEKVTEIISEAVALRNDLIRRVNNPEKSDNPRDVKNHFNLLKKDLCLKIEQLLGQLNDLSKED